MLQAVQARSSSLSKGLLGYLGAQTRVPFAELYGVASFYALLDAGRPHVAIRLCNGVPCILAGAEALGNRLLAQTGSPPDRRGRTTRLRGNGSRALASATEPQPL